PTMAPKNKGKKPKKADDDDYWAVAGESVPANGIALDTAAADDDMGSSKRDESFSFAALDAGDIGANEEEDFGGLMSAIKATAKKSKKNKRANVESLNHVESDEETKAARAATQKPIEVTADDLADEEWGPSTDKKKGKKGKGKKGEQVDEDEDGMFFHTLVITRLSTSYVRR
ncbi:hypothetical protein FISHEDRAFT_49938, partial [Fistulina hepatica ATCC 64428]